jgi:hypothetical protein
MDSATASSQLDNPGGPKKMRRIVIAKALFLIVVASYLAIGMSKASKTGDDAAHPTASTHQKLLR